MLYSHQWQKFAFLHLVTRVCRRIILNLRNSMNTFLYKKLSSGDAVSDVTTQQLGAIPMEELRILHSISQLTGVLLEGATAYLGVDTRDLAVIPRADQAEVQWTRRTLHEYVNYCCLLQCRIIPHLLSPIVMPIVYTCTAIFLPSLLLPSLHPNIPMPLILVQLCHEGGCLSR